MSLIEISMVALSNWKAFENESLDILHNISLDNPQGMKEWYDLVPGNVFVSSWWWSIWNWLTWLSISSEEIKEANARNNILAPLKHL